MHQYIRVNEGILEYLSQHNTKNLVNEEKHYESSVFQEETIQRRAEYEEARDDVNASDRYEGKAFIRTNRSVNSIDKVKHPFIVNNIKKTGDIKPKSATDEKKVLDASQTTKTLPPHISRMDRVALRMKQEGKERRERIEKAKADKIKAQQGSSKKISVEQARNIYIRGMSMKAKLEQRREDESLFQYVSPLFNPIVVVEPMMRNKTPVRSRSTFRARSVTNHARPKSAPEQREAPIRSNGSQTTSNLLMRNRTPIRSRSRMRPMIPSAV